MPGIAAPLRDTGVPRQGMDIRLSPDRPRPAYLFQPDGSDIRADRTCNRAFDPLMESRETSPTYSLVSHIRMEMLATAAVLLVAYSAINETVTLVSG